MLIVRTGVFGRARVSPFFSKNKKFALRRVFEKSGIFLENFGIIFGKELN